MKKAILLGITIIFASCGMINKMATFSKCDFKLKSVEGINIAGVDIQKVTSLSNLNFADAARIATAYTTNSLFLNFTANVLVKNPNPSPAAMTKMDWILNIDDTQIISGAIANSVHVPSNNGTTIIPIQIKADLVKVLSGKSAEVIKNFAFGLVDANSKATSRIKLKIKPYITVAGIPLSYPDYITVLSY